ncbi:MAG: lipid-A-disaccharide synthase [Pseudohongiellaceae bacterium]
MTLRIGLVAGESSGDMLGQGLIRALRERCPDVEFSGIGGPRMQEEGFRSLEDMERLSVMGFVEPLGRLPELLGIMSRVQQHFETWRADVVIGIDSPGFNLRLERRLHEAGLRTVHYVSPSVWAWGRKRVQRMAGNVDLVLALLPFETAIYQEQGIAAEFVGHPLADRIDPGTGYDRLVRDRHRETFGIAGEAPVIALMPGSRHNEVARLGQLFLRAFQSCLDVRPDLRAVIPCATPARRTQVAAMVEALPASCRERCVLLDGQSHEAMLSADVVVLASGTATLEGMLLRRPMVVAYRLAPLTWMLASRLLRVPYVSLPNLLAGDELIPELLQSAVTPDALRGAILRWLGDRDAVERLCRRFDGLHEVLRRDASDRAAGAVLRLTGAAGGS